MFGVPTTGFDRLRPEIAEEIRSVLIACARARRTISYGDLVAGLRSFRMEPNDPRLFDLLGEISAEEDAAGRSMLSAVVVGRASGLPGKGFFELAESLGRKVGSDSAKLKFFVEELARVHDAWRRH